MDSIGVQGFWLGFECRAQGVEVWARDFRAFV